MEDTELLEKTNKIVEPYGLTAEILPDISSVGVQGDSRTYSPVMVLKGPFPGWDILEKLSTEISNTTQVNRVTYDATPTPAQRS